MNKDTASARKQFFDQLFSLDSTDSRNKGSAPSLSATFTRVNGNLAAITGDAGHTIRTNIHGTAVALLESFRESSDDGTLKQRADDLEGAILVAMTAEYISQTDGDRLIDQLHDILGEK